MLEHKGKISSGKKASLVFLLFFAVLILVIWLMRLYFMDHMYQNAEFINGTMWKQVVFLIGIVLLSTVGVVWFFRSKVLDWFRKFGGAAQKVEDEDLDSSFSIQECSEIKAPELQINQGLEDTSQANKIQEEIVANIAHDLRSPLTMIIGYAQMMQEIPGENTLENLQVIIDEADRMSLLVNDILDLTKRKEEAPPLNLKEFYLTDLLKEIVGHYQKLTENHPWEITLQQDCRVLVRADELEISRVVYNFISNAINHTDENKKIQIIQDVYENKVFVRVKDNGKGIPKEQLDSIWERFYRVDRSKKLPLAGSGLGLCIAKTILEQHEAQYGVESQPDQGSTFWFALDALNLEQSDQTLKKEEN